MSLETGPFGRYYACVPCGFTIGVHKDGRIKGTPADAETRAARIRAHEVFDELWQGDGTGTPAWRRDCAYRLMTAALGLPRQVHIAELDVAGCHALIARVPAVADRMRRIGALGERWGRVLGRLAKT